MSNENFEQVFQVTGSARLELNNIRGSVDIRTGVDGVIAIKAEKQVDTGDARQTVIEMEQAPDGTVIVKTRFPKDLLDLLFGAKPCKVDYIVTAPRACTLKVNGVSNSVFVEGFAADASFKTVSGDMTVRAVNGSLNFDSVSGDILLSDLVGKVHLNTVSGDVKGTHLSGDLHLNTVSGDVKFEGSSLTSINGSTISGEMKLETSLGDGPYKFNSVSGDLTMKLPADAVCTAELVSMSGNLSIKFPTTSVSRGNGRFIADIQGGGVKIYLNSLSGDMELKS